MKNNLWPAIFYFTLATLSLTPLHAQTSSLQLRTEVAPQKAYIGDLIKCKLSVFYTEKISIIASTAPLVLGEFELRDQSISQPQRVGNEKFSTTQTLTLICFSTGTQILPSIPLKIATADGKITEAATEPLKIEIKSLLQEKGDEGGLRPLKGFYTVPSYLWLWILGGLIALGSLIFFGRRYLKTKGILGAVNQGPIRPCEDIAWDALHKLEFSDLIEKGMIKAFYSELSFILRQYLEGRYKISALDRTTSELILEIRRLDLSFTLSTQLRDFLDSGDLVKFAKFTPGTEEIEKDLNRVKEIVSLTTPQKTPQEEKAPV